MNGKPLTVAVVGATGVVGRTMIQVLDERDFPVGELRLLASGRSAGRTVSSRGRTIEIAEATPDAFDGVDIALFSAGADISRELAPAAAARGATVIDNSSAWRMEPDVPLVVSQVNPGDLEGHEGIIANPNCSTMQLVPVLMALRDSVGLERVVVDTYQSVSGTGAERDRRTRRPDPGPRRGRGRRSPPSTRTRSPSTRSPRSTYSSPNGYTKEEWKVVSESRKILHLPDLPYLLHGRAHPGLRQPFGGRPRRDARPARRRRGRASCSQRSRASSSRTTRPPTTIRWPPRPPARDEIFVGRVRQDVSIPDDRGHRVLGRLGQPAQGRGDERRGDRRGPGRAGLGASRTARGARPYRGRGATRGGLA